MKKIVVTQFITLDGVIEDPHLWSFDYWNDETGNYKLEELFASDAQLLGRVTYEGFAEAWPDRTDDSGFADRINNVPKYVVSTTLKQADLTWNNSHVINGDVVAELQKLKQGDGGDILVHGSGTLVQTLIENDLVDEYHLVVYPLILGKGLKLFGDDLPKKPLKLAESQILDNGVMILTYVPAV